jgi:pyruvate formate-lyase activating enzyme-like uncharacterized protein
MEANRREYGDRYGQMPWISPEKAAIALEHRERLIADLPATVRMRFRATKPVYRILSPGCELCGSGEWSCLFINGICNGGCFFCPAEQRKTGEPMTHGLRFSRPRDYLDYLERFGFRGMSISGGEPLMTFERTLQFVTAVKRRLGRRIHLWLYTNGRLVDPEKLRRLAEAGLDEIRFNIKAVNYDIAGVSQAAVHIPSVTVEVPAVPEDYAVLQASLPRFRDAGVKFLNLHQLRCTPHNLDRLLQRGYTFLHGPRVTVLESELTALRLMRDAAQRELALPVHYCTFAYRNRYQTSAHQRRFAVEVQKPFESLTALGLIRRTALRGPVEVVKTIAGRLREKGVDRELWELDAPSSRLTFHPSIGDRVDPAGSALGGCELVVSYFAASLSEAVSYRHGFRKIPLNPRKTIIVERRSVLDEQAVAYRSLSAFMTLISRQPEHDKSLEEMADPQPLPDSILASERFEHGMPDYY